MRYGVRLVRCGLVCGLVLGALGCSKKDEAPTGAETAPQAAGEAPGQPGEAPAKAEGAAKAEAPTGGVQAAPGAPAKAAPPPVTGTPPAVLGVLSAEHTAAVTGVEGLDGMARALSAVMDRLPAEMKTQMQDDLPRGFDSVVEKMGFDPRDAKAWGTVGVDPAAGLAVVVDTRLMREGGQPWPVVMARVTDRGTLVAALRRIDPAFEVGLPETDGVAKVTTPGGRGFLGAKGDFTAVMMVPGADAEAEAEAGRAAFAAWLTASDGSIAAAEALAPAVAMGEGARGFVVALTGPAMRLAGDALPPAMAAFYQARFPALSLWMDGELEDGRLRLLADAAGVEALRKTLVSPHAAPDLHRFAPADSMVVGLGINPVSLFDGVVALIPPERGDIQGQVLIGKNAIPMVTGASLDDLGAALSGQVVMGIGLDAFAGDSAGPAFVAVGVADAAVLDRILPAVLDKIAAQAGGERSPALFGALEGHMVEGRGPTTYVVRSGDAVLVGKDRASIEQALARGARPGDGPRLDLGDGAFYGLAFTAGLVEAGLKQAPPEAAEVLRSAGGLWKDHFGGGMNITMRVDDHGIRSDGAGAAALLGIGTAVAIPAFVKYMRKARSAQARVELNRLYTQVTLARLEGKPLTAVPLTPALDPCADGGDGSYASTPDMWSHPTWTALGFAPTGKQSYRYALEPGEGQAFTVRAVGDQNCDGVTAEFVYAADAEGQRLPDAVQRPLE